MKFESEFGESWSIVNFDTKKEVWQKI